MGDTWRRALGGPRVFHGPPWKKGPLAAAEPQRWPLRHAAQMPAPGRRYPFSQLLGEPPADRSQLSSFPGIAGVEGGRLMQAKPASQTGGCGAQSLSPLNGEGPSRPRSLARDRPRPLLPRASLWPALYPSPATGAARQEATCPRISTSESGSRRL